MDVFHYRKAMNSMEFQRFFTIKPLFSSFCFSGLRLAAGSLRAAVRPALDGGQQPRGVSEPEEGATFVPDSAASPPLPGAAVTACTRSRRASGCTLTRNIWQTNHCHAFYSRPSMLCDWTLPLGMDNLSVPLESAATLTTSQRVCQSKVCGDRLVWPFLNLWYLTEYL